MYKKLIPLALMLLVTACGTTSSLTTRKPSEVNAQGVRFDKFYAQLRKEAIGKGYDVALLDDAFDGRPAPIGAVVKSENSQPELIRSFAEYTGGMLSTARISKGVENLKEHADDLAKSQARTGVSSSVVVALWGIETNFGKVQGDHPVVPALVTLAWQSPRSDYFRKETYAALDILKKTGKKPSELKGSWAGAMGQCQFMPSSYLAYATDGDDDGKADIWTNEADVFASASTYLQKRGWKPEVPWRLAVNEEFRASDLKLNTRGLSEPESLGSWKSRGFKVPDDLDISSSEKFRYYKPQADGPAYLLGPNFSVILSWNNSSYFAWSVLALAETIEQESQQ